MAGRRAVRITRRVTPAGKVAWAVIIAIIVIGGGYWAWTALNPGASYRAQVTGHTAVNSSTLSVAVRVTNTGQGAGTRSCQINASDPSGAHTGADLVTLRGALAPGATANFADPAVTITGQGARSVTSVTVKCS